MALWIALGFTWCAVLALVAAIRAARRRVGPTVEVGLRFQRMVASLLDADPVQLEWSPPLDEIEMDEDGLARVTFAVKHMRRTVIGGRHMLDAEDVLTVLEALAMIEAPINDAVRTMRGLYGDSLGRVIR